MPHVVVMPLVSQTLGQKLGLDNRKPLLKILNRLYDQLENHADRYRNQRDPKDEALFDYVVYLEEMGNWHTFRFSVDDTQAADYLFVVAVSHRPGKVRM